MPPKPKRNIVRRSQHRLNHIIPQGRNFSQDRGPFARVGCTIQIKDCNNGVKFGVGFFVLVGRELYFFSSSCQEVSSAGSGVNTTKVQIQFKKLPNSIPMKGEGDFDN